MRRERFRLTVAVSAPRAEWAFSTHTGRSQVGQMTVRIFLHSMWPKWQESTRFYRSRHVQLTTGV